jgi:hypothetical protein
MFIEFETVAVLLPAHLRFFRAYAVGLEILPLVTIRSVKLCAGVSVKEKGDRNPDQLKQADNPGRGEDEPEPMRSTTSNCKTR